MKNFIVSILLSCFFMACPAQEYSVTSGGQGKQGGYIVNVTVMTKKNPKEKAPELALTSAVKGVLFNGVKTTDGYGEQKALIADPNIETTKAEFFNAFFNEGIYKRFATMVPTSISVMQNKQIKKWETTATVVVDKEALLAYLEECNIIRGFSDLW